MEHSAVSGSNIKYIGEVITKMLEIVVDIYISVMFANGHKLCPAPSWHISVLLRSGIHSHCSRRENHLSSTSNVETLITNCPLLLIIPTLINILVNVPIYPNEILL